MRRRRAAAPVGTSVRLLLSAVAVLAVVGSTACSKTQPRVQTQLGDPRVRALVLVLQDVSSGQDACIDSSRELSEIGTPAVAPLIEALCRPKPESELHPDFAMNAQDVLSAIGAPAVVPLIEALGDRSSRNRDRVAGALGYIGDARAVGPLIAVLRDQDCGVDAADALAQIGDKRAVEPLTLLLKDKNSNLRVAAAAALQQIQDGRAGKAASTDPTQLEGGGSTSGSLPRDFPRYTQETAGEDAFSTADSVKQVVSFYQKKLKAAGWEVEPGMVVEETGGGYQSAVVTAQRRTESVAVTITRQPGQDTQVIIMYLN